MSAAKKRGLGRGLDSLIQSAPPAPTGARQVPVGELHPNRDQPRSRFDESGLEELAESIRAQGVIQPIIVTARETGSGFTIVAGERRWRAAQRAGLKEVPALVREISDDQELLEVALVENLQRSDLNPIEEAEAYQTLQEKFSLSQDDLASRVGKARTTVSNTLRLLRLPSEVMDLLRDGSLAAGQARPLLALGTEEEQRRWAQRAVEKNLSAREIERLVRSAKGEGKPRSARARSVEVHTAAAEETLTQKLQTRVEIRRSGKGGRVLLHFHTEEELIRLYDLLISKGEGP